MFLPVLNVMQKHIKDGRSDNNKLLDLSRANNDPTIDSKIKSYIMDI